MRLSKTLAAAAGLLAGLAGTALGIQPGDPAPDFTLQDISGRSYTLSSFRGKVVLLGLIGYD